MGKRPNKKNIMTDMPDSEFWDGPEELHLKQAIIQQQHALAADLIQQVPKTPADMAKLFAGFLEIADFMFKNTCGVGSNFQLAECDLKKIRPEDIRRYYDCILILLAYHFCRFVPKYKDKVWLQLIALTNDPDLCLEFSKELETCVDHENGGFSPVQAGYKFWVRAQAVLHVQSSVKDSTARIYYQTAPGQNLIYLVEQGALEGWLKTE